MLLKNFLVVTFLIGACCTYTLSAQNDDRNSITLSFGGSNLHILDEHANYLIFSGTGIAPALNFYHTTPQGFHQVNGTFYKNKLTASADNFQTELFGGQFRYSYFRNITTSPIGFSLGLTLSSVYFKTNYSFSNRVSWLRAIESWYWSHSAGVAFQLRREYNRNEFTLNAFIPVISNVSRPAYSSSGDYNYESNDWDVKTFGETFFMTGNPGINTQLLYARRLSVRLKLSAEYEFFYSQNKDPELIRLYMNNFRVGLSYCF
jgi:hypothetical protein